MSDEGLDQLMMALLNEPLKAGLSPSQQLIQQLIEEEKARKSKDQDTE